MPRGKSKMLGNDEIVRAAQIAASIAGKESKPNLRYVEALKEIATILEVAWHKGKLSGLREEARTFQPEGVEDSASPTEDQPQ